MHVFNVTVVSNSSYLYPQWLLAGSEKEKKKRVLSLSIEEDKSKQVKKKKKEVLRPAQAFVLLTW